MTTVKTLIDATAQQKPNALFALYPETGQVLSWLQLQTAACQVVTLCVQIGNLPNQPLAFMMGNGYAALQLLLGTMYANRICLAINLVSGDSQIAHSFKQSGCQHVVVDEENQERLDKIIKSHQLSLKTIVVHRDKGITTTSTKPSEQSKQDTPTPSSCALLMYTSGTTGVPKGVVHTHKSVLAGGYNTALAHQLTEQDRALCVLPLYHINGQCVTVFAPLVSQSSVVMPHRFRTSTFWQTIADKQCTWFSVVPTLISYLLHDTTPLPPADRLRHLRFGRSASSPLSPTIQQNFEDRFQIPIIETMGLTETAAQILSNPLPPATRKIGSPGIAYGNQVQIYENDKQCPENTIGELVIRGDNVMQGYNKNPEQTAATFTKDGWLLTGDLGYCDQDGYYFITGRRKELIIKGGENIAPREVDEALLTLPYIIEAAAFAVPCDTYGQRISACVVLEPCKPEDEQAIINHCHEQIGKFKSPDRIYFMQDLPKGPSGKIQRLKLKELAT